MELSLDNIECEALEAATTKLKLPCRILVGGCGSNLEQGPRRGTLVEINLGPNRAAHGGGGHLERVWQQRVCLYLITEVLAKLEGQDWVGIHYYTPLSELLETVLIDSVCSGTSVH